MSVEKVNLKHCWWENKLAQATWKAICNSYDAVIQLLQIWSKETFMEAYATMTHIKKAKKKMECPLWEMIY